MDITPAIPVLLIILAVALLELLICSVPIRLRMRFEYIDDVGKANFSLLWLCLGIQTDFFRGNRNVDVLLDERALFSTRFPEHARAPMKPPMTGPEPMEKEILAHLTSLESMILHIPHIISFARSAVSSTSVEKVDCRATLGLSSPAQTGIVYGYYWALKSMFPYPGRSHIVIIPDFHRQRLEGYLEVVLKVRHPFALIIRLWRLYTRLHASPAKRTTGWDGEA